jgi:hypothetical protein
MNLKLYYKQKLKQMAIEIKSLKLDVKVTQKSGAYAGEKQSALHFLRRRCRYYHLNYGILREVPIEKIESKIGSAIDQKLLNDYKIQAESLYNLEIKETSSKEVVSTN